MHTPSRSRRARTRHVELRLDWLIARAAGTAARDDGRLDAIETTMALAARPWRGFTRPLRPARDLRMSDATCEALIGWVNAERHAQGAVLARLAVYASGAVTDSSVPDGWVRLRVHDRDDARFPGG